MTKVSKTKAKTVATKKRAKKEKPRGKPFTEMNFDELSALIDAETARLAKIEKVANEEPDLGPGWRSTADRLKTKIDDMKVLASKKYVEGGSV